MSIQVQVLSYGGMPASWGTIGKGTVKVGQSITIGSGMGPFFTVIGVQGGAIFSERSGLNITLKVQGVAEEAFRLHNGLCSREYIALEVVYKVRFCRFSGSFEPIFDVFSGGNINLRI